MDLRESMTTGVLVEFVAPTGLVVGQVVLAPWRGRTLPAVGERFSCTVPAAGSRLEARRLSGAVRERSLELQQDDQGRPCVWARLEVAVGALALDATSRHRARAARPGLEPGQWFSSN